LWAAERGHAIEGSRLFEGAPPPPVDAYDLLVVMGGPMGVGDTGKYPWMGAEKRCIAEAIEAGRSVVGVCLGAQLIAEVLGARVYRNAHREIGWFPVTPAPGARDDALLDGFPSVFEAFHWHGDRFDIPAGARRLAGSEGCANQVFASGDGVVGLQCHLESTPESVAALIENCADEIVPGPFVQDADTMRRGVEAIGRMRPLLYGLLDNIVDGGG
jgi:GMP synthase-like glutamine amidotransferase